MLREQTPVQTETQIIIYKECINRFEIYPPSPKTLPKPDLGPISQHSLQNHLTFKREVSKTPPQTLADDLGVPQNDKTAVKWYTLAAEQGNADAQSNLGVMYAKGDGVPQNYKTAVKWYTLAAEQGFAVAQTNLGIMYENGYGVPQDYKTAVKWYRLAAEQGNVRAQSNLGLMYGEGQGVLQDYVRAHMWWIIAASSGYKVASENRDIVAKRMNSNQIETAQRLAQECEKKNYKGC